MASPSCNSSSSLFSCLLFALFTLHLPTLLQAKTSQCRTSCGQIPISYPFGIDDGCGSPYYRHILVCTETGRLELRTPSGRYPIQNISYTDPHILVTDPFMWNCQDANDFRPTRPFSLDTSTHFRLSPQNDYLFFNCSENDVIMEAKPMFCERFPEQCDSTCDTSSYLCRRLPQCSLALRGSSCCSYYPKGSESLRMMLRHCSTYTSIYWRNLGITPAYSQIPEYGIRVDFDIPVTTKCLTCQDGARGGGTCGFDTQTQDFLCYETCAERQQFCSSFRLAYVHANGVSLKPFIICFPNQRLKNLRIFGITHSRIIFNIEVFVYFIHHLSSFKNESSFFEFLAPLMCNLMFLRKMCTYFQPTFWPQQQQNISATVCIPESIFLSSRGPIVMFTTLSNKYAFPLWQRNARERRWSARAKWVWHNLHL